MARFIILAFLVATVVAVNAASSEEYDPLEPDYHRTRRVTCDLLSYGGKVGDSACAVRCLITGKAGGHCEGGVCRCRK